MLQASSRHCSKHASSNAPACQTTVTVTIHIHKQISFSRKLCFLKNLQHGIKTLSTNNHYNGYQRNLPTLWTRPEIRTTVELGIQTSGPSCYGAPAWPCTGALCPCICHPPPESISASDHDGLGVANENVTVTDPACPQQSSAHSMRRTESKNHRLQGALSATS